MKLAIIPARGGSKRIPRKNIKLFDGKPMLAYAIACAKQSGLFDEIAVSSDDDEILTLAAKLGAKTLKRPAELAGDHVATVPVIAHAIEVYAKSGAEPESVCCIYPAVPFLQSNVLRDAFALFNEKNADYVLPVAAFASPIQRALCLDADGKISPFDAKHECVRTQDLPPAYYDAGQFYWGKKSAWLAGKSIHSHGTGFVIPAWMAIDIDTPEDWHRAELTRQVQNLKEKSNNDTSNV